MAQVGDFRLAEPGAELAAEIAPLLRLAQPALRARAIGAGNAIGIALGRKG
jgi:hypothetical protein